MIIVHSNFPKGEVKVKVQNRDDLWYLSQIVEEADRVSGVTFRKIKHGGTSDRTEVTKKKVFLTITVTKIEFHPYTQDLRIGGEVAEGTEDVAKGEHHTFNVEEGTELSIVKPRLLKHQIDRIKEASENKSTHVLVCALDRDQVTFALLRKYGYEVLGSSSGQVAKKMMNENISKNFYDDVAKQLVDYAKRYEIQTIVLGSPAFWKEQLAEVLKKHQLPRVIMASCYSTGKSAIAEILKRPETIEAMKNERAVSEMAKVEEVFTAIAKDEAVAYGKKEVHKASEQGAIGSLLLTDGFMARMRAEEKAEELGQLMGLVEQSKGTITIVSSEHEGGVKLDGLGGIAALLRFALQ